MHVVIVGCGRVGSGLARIIEEKGHSVAVVDKDPRAFRRLHSGFSGKQVVGVGFPCGCGCEYASEASPPVWTRCAQHAHDHAESLPTCGCPSCECERRGIDEIDLVLQVVPPGRPSRM